MRISPDRRWRWPGAAVLAAAVTSALFALMYYLTAADNGGAYTRAQRPLTLDFVRVERDSTLIEKTRFLPPKPKAAKPPSHRPPIPLPPERTPRALSRDIQPPSYVPAIDSALDAIGFARTRDIAPLARISPVYPPSAERRGIEGWVRVAFTIAEDGSVVEPRVVDAEPKSVFDRAALRAISKWRYQPQVIDGKAIRRAGVEVTVEFRLQE